MNNHNLFYEIILDICHARAPTCKWRCSLKKERKQTNIKKKKKLTQTIYCNTPLTSVKCHFKLSKSRNSSVTQDKQGAKAF